MRGLVRQRITGVIKELWSAATVVAYGSTMTHMALPNSDIDLAVAAGYTGAHPWFELVSRLVKAGVCTAESTQVKRSVMARALSLLTCPHISGHHNVASASREARGVHFRHGSGHLVWRRPEADAAVGLEVAQRDAATARAGAACQVVAVAVSSCLLPVVRAHPSHRSPRVRRRALNNVYDGGLGSFTLVVMCRHFLCTLDADALPAKQPMAWLDKENGTKTQRKSKINPNSS